jgi:hypothetical protein
MCRDIVCDAKIPDRTSICLLQSGQIANLLIRSSLSVRCCKRMFQERNQEALRQVRVKE